MSLLAVRSNDAVATDVLVSLSLRASRPALYQPRLQLDFDDLVLPPRVQTPVMRQVANPVEEDPERWDGLS
jgi:hypothetical protein